MQLTDQERTPHKSLVQVRNSIEATTGCGRKQAAGIANGMSHEQCDLCIKADGDMAKIEAVINRVTKPDNGKQSTKRK